MAFLILSQVHQKWATLVSSCLAASTLGLAWYWANLYIFTISYIKSHSEAGSAPVTAWVMPTWLSGSVVGSLVVENISRLFGKRPALFLGVCLHCAGLTLGYFVIGYSEVLLYIFVGFFCGVANGITLVTMIQIVVEWFGDRSGLIIGLIRGASVLGGVPINQFVTSYVNPDNQIPDVRVGPLRYFTQEDILHRAHLVYLYIGGCTFGLQMIALFFIREKREPSPRDSTETVSYATFNGTDNRNQLVVQNSYEMEVTETNNCSSNRRAQMLTPKEVLKRTEFYVIFITVALADIGYIVVINFYQAYGQLLIHDDLCLAILVDLFVVFVTIGFVAWGVLLDKVTIKTGLIVYFVSLPFVLFLIFFTPFLNKWLYFTAVSVFAVVGAPLFVVYSAVTSKAFGIAHFPQNYGMVTTSSMIMNMLNPMIIETVIEQVGWFYMFVLSASMDLVALLLVVVFLKEGI